jgi:hypothetical protein
MCILLAALPLLIAGCGGGGEGRGSSPNEQTRQRVRQTLGQSQLASLQGGFQTPGQATPDGDAEGGAGSGFGMIGSFVLGFGQSVAGTRTAKPPYRSRDDDGGGSPPDGGECPPGECECDDCWEDWSFYYDHYLGLWVEHVEGDAEYTLLLWEDEGKTLPAGSFRTSFESKDAYPIAYWSEYEITAGPMRGANGRYDVVHETERNGHAVYRGTWPDWGAYSGHSRWGDDGFVWTSEFEGVDGSWSRDSGRFNADGSGTVTSANSTGYKWSYRYNSDGSGSGLIEGPDPGLPAKVVWRNGKYRIEYADGTVEEWDMDVWLDRPSATAASTRR